ncbi:hypothetical protein E8E12_001883 [Didymella heteroderae]|uniref:Uncharacterized protein n=1 Tax=Didymella heteroderae TaxID=1769908 RepID=A0A9P5BW10_9PLEO|nr:hypothetical protein E8E12_001883 [Didymella heteroderae]
MSAENLSADPNEHDLLGFPGVKAEHPKIYLRRLWLPAENDRTTYPRFYDTTIKEMAQLANRVVNSLANDAARRNEELQGGAFLESEANWILEVKRYGSRIWGEDYGTSTRLKSNLGGIYPRWGAWTASGEQVSNDQEMIKLTFRHWLAARLQEKINAPTREARRAAETSERRQSGPGSHQHESAQEELPYHASLPLHPPDGGTAGIVQKASLCTYDDEMACDVALNTPVQDPCILDIEPSQHHDSLKRKRSNASEKADVERRLQSSEITAAARQGSPKLNLLTDTMNSGVMPDDIISVAQCLYRESPHRHPHDDWYNDFRVLSQALDDLEHLAAQGTTADNAQSSPEDPLPKFTAEKTVEARLRVFRGSRAQMQQPYSLETWTIALALLFEGLLPGVGIPSSFEDMVRRLRTALQFGESTKPEVR